MSRFQSELQQEFIELKRRRIIQLLSPLGEAPTALFIRAFGTPETMGPEKMDSALGLIERTYTKKGMAIPPSE